MLEYTPKLSREERSFLIATYNNSSVMNAREGGVNKTINFVLWAMANPAYSHLYGEIEAGLEEFGLVNIRTIMTSHGLKDFILITEEGLKSIDGKVTLH